jgi:hypothetical protein
VVGRRGFLRLAGVASAVGGVSRLSGVAAADALVDGGAVRYVGEIVGTAGYDYAPTVMWGDGVTMKMWWCGTEGGGDVIYYSELDGGSWSSPVVVLTPSTSAWDEYHVCDPSVVEGDFTADGTSWSYAMYYAGADDAVGTDTHVGVAFSNDGTSWQKYSGNPLIHPETHDGGYGAGMPSAHRASGTDDTVRLAFFDASSDPNNHYVVADDAVSFGARTDLTATPVAAAMGDIAYVPSEGVWYVCTKNNNDEECYLYKTATDDLNSTWTQAARVNAALTGNSHNHNPCWLRHPNGDLYRANGTRYNRVYFGTGTDDPNTWDVGEAIYMDGWEFDVDGNTEQWTSVNVSADGDEPTDGSWKCIADQDDPHWLSPDLAIHADATETVSILMSNQNDDTNGRIYFRTPSDDGYSQVQSVGFAVDNSGDWLTYDVDMSVNDGWDGMVTGLRVDPIETGSGDPLGVGHVRLDH